jgi:hypothetical protein
MPKKSQQDDFFKRALHRFIAREIRQGSDVLEHARQKVSEWENSIEPQPLYVAAWKSILSLSDDEVARIITRPTEEMERWRCSTPFLSDNLTDPEWRLRLLRKLRKLKKYGYGK